MGCGHYYTSPYTSEGSRHMKYTEIKYVPVADSVAQWGNKVSITKRYEGLSIYTLNRWLAEMRNNPKFSKGVINPTHKLVLVNFQVFEKFLYWKQHQYLK